MNISLIVTAQGDCKNINRLFKSLEENIINCKQHSKINIIFIAQDIKSNEMVLPYNLSESIKVIHADRMSLSKARNIGLQYVNCPVDLIGFPDDDCWYPADFFHHLIKVYINKSQIIITSVYDPFAKKHYGGRNFQKIVKINSWNILKIPLSVAIFIPIINIDCLKVKFIENIGAGNIIGSGEESIYLAHHMTILEKRATFFPALRVFHENENSINLKKTYLYSIGFGYISMYLVFSYKRYGLVPYFFYVILKGLLGSLIFIFSPKKSFNYLIRSLSIIIGATSYFLIKL